MGIRSFYIKFDHAVFYPGETISGHVYLSVDDSLNLRGINLSLFGKARCGFWYNDYNNGWNGSDSDSFHGWHRRDSDSFHGWHRHDSDNFHHRRHHNHSRYAERQEIFFQIVKNLLDEEGQEFRLPVGEHQYPFSETLPSTLPPTFSGTYGKIYFYGEVELDIPWSFNKTRTKAFIVADTPIDLSSRPDLIQPYKTSNSKVFCCLCCTSGPLTLKVSVPRTGFNDDEVIPITVEANNKSNVDLRYVDVRIEKIITWNSVQHRKTQVIKEKWVTSGGVKRREFKTWNVEFPLAGKVYDNTGNNQVIQVRYELKTKLVAPFPHFGLNVKIPLVIGRSRRDRRVPEQQPPGPFFGFLQGQTMNTLASDTDAQQNE